MADLNEKMFDSLIHIKSKESGGESISEKKHFPITRYADVLGAPHLVDMSTVKTAFPDEYLLLETGEIQLSDTEYNACFGDLTTI